MWHFILPIVSGVVPVWGDLGFHWDPRPKLQETLDPKPQR